MLIFPILSTLVWALAMLFRRTWTSAAIVTGALLALLGLMSILSAWHEHMPPTLRLVRELLWPYILLTGGVGYYICLLPRPPTGTTQCKGCGYELSGLNPINLNCPECGRQWRGAGSGLEEKPSDLIPIPKRPVKKRIT